MRRIIDNDFLTMISRLVIGGMFVYASFYKIIEPLSFAKSIWYYHLVPGSLINIMAIVLPWIELIVGLALIGGIWFRGAVLWVNFLTIFFIVALGSTIVRGIDIDCGCFKAAQSATGSAWDSVIFDVGMLVLTIQLWLTRSRRWMLQRSR